MLDDLVLHDADSGVPQALVERRRIGVFLRRALENALAAGAVDRLADDVAAALEEFGEVLLAGLQKVQPAALHLCAKELVELGLVVKEVPELLVVHPRHDAVGDAAGDLRGALRVA